jgi:hypothetical protein
MAARTPRRWFACVVAIGVFATGCSSGRREALLPPETFSWVRQPIAFAPPPGRWERQGDGGGGWTGVRFILRGGGGQCIGVEANRQFAERDRRQAIARLAGQVDSLTQNEFLQELSLARPRTDDPISERESEASRAINASLDRAVEDYLGGNRAFVASDLEAALRGAMAYEPGLAELLPAIRLWPERMQEPDRWRLGRDRDTVWAGRPAFASDDTLIAPEQTLLYHQVFWVVKGCAFKATFQGRPENLNVFHRVVDSIQFPEPRDAWTR